MNSATRPLPPEMRGGFAPQSSPSLAAAHSNPVCLVASVLFAACVTVPAASLSFVSVPASIELSPAYRQSEPGFVCAFVTMECGVMRNQRLFMNLVSAGKSIEARKNLFPTFSKSSQPGTALNGFARLVGQRRDTVEQMPERVIFEAMPTLQRAAMLGMIHTSMTTAITKRMMRIEDCQDAPAWAEFTALRDLGFAEKNPGARYHTLTDAGRKFGTQYLIPFLCQQYKIHVMTEAHHQGFTSFGCSCGGWSMTANGRGMHQWRRASNAWGTHVPKLKAEDV